MKKRIRLSSATRRLERLEERVAALEERREEDVTQEPVEASGEESEVLESSEDSIAASLLELAKALVSNDKEDENS